MNFTWYARSKRPAVSSLLVYGTPAHRAKSRSIFPKAHPSSSITNPIEAIRPSPSTRRGGIYLLAGRFPTNYEPLNQFLHIEGILRPVGTGVLVSRDTASLAVATQTTRLHGPKNAATQIHHRPKAGEFRTAYS